MFKGFEQLVQLKDRDEWKQAYNEAVENLDQLYQEEDRLYYLMYAQGKQAHRIDEIQNTKHKLMTDERLKETLSCWKEAFIDEPVWHRRLDVFLSRMKEERLDSHPDLVKIQTELQSKLMDSTLVVNGDTYNLGTVHSNIMENPDRTLRKQLFIESKRIGEKNEGLFRTLIKQRNQLAREYGYKSYYHFRCNMKEIDIELYFDEMTSLLQQSEQSSKYWDGRIKEKFRWETIHHYDQYFSTFNFHQIQDTIFDSDRMIPVLNDVISSLGIPQVPVSIECLEIPYGGFCINIHPDDIKLVVNRRDTYSAFLSGIHELGHAIDGHYGSFQYPELYRFFSSVAAEGIAELFQTIITEKEFLKKNFEIQGEVYEQIEEVNHLMNLNMVKINHYYSLVEYELYCNPERGFQDIADECYHVVFGYDGEAFHPASEMFYIENPAFFQDYNFALAIRDMIRNKFKIKSIYGNEVVFLELLEKYIKPNQLYSWKERIEHLCGEPHTFAYLSRTLVESLQE